jgi:hypothetical protein
VISAADRDSQLNATYLEFYARFADTFVYTADYTRSTNVFPIGLAAERQWIELEGLEVKSGSDYLPLKRGTFGDMLFLAASEGATAALPTEYGLASQSRNLITNQSLFSVSVYPVPTGSFIIRGRIKTFPAELSAGGDQLSLDEEHGDHVARLAAARAGLLLGYPPEWFSDLLAPFSDYARRELKLDEFRRWSRSLEPRRLEESANAL